MRQDSGVGPLADGSLSHTAKFGNHATGKITRITGIRPGSQLSSFQLAIKVASPACAAFRTWRRQAIGGPSADVLIAEVLTESVFGVPHIPENFFEKCPALTRNRVKLIDVAIGTICDDWCLAFTTIVAKQRPAKYLATTSVTRIVSPPHRKRNQETIIDFNNTNFLNNPMMRNSKG